jgi:hypothetical protein
MSISVNYSQVYERHLGKLNLLMHGIISGLLKAQNITFSDIIIGYPASDLENSNNTIDGSPVVNIFPTSSTVSTVDAQNQRREDISWNIVVLIRDSSGSIQTSYNTAIKAARLVAQYLEQYWPDSSTDYVGYCVRVDQVGGSNFSLPDGSGAVSQFQIRSALQSFYAYNPVKGVTNMPAITQRHKWVSAEVVFTDDIVATDSATFDCDDSNTLTIATVMVNKYIDILNTDIGFDNGYLIDENGNILNRSITGDGIRFDVSSYDTISGKKFTMFAWLSATDNIFFGQVTVISPSA